MGKVPLNAGLFVAVALEPERGNAAPLLADDPSHLAAISAIVCRPMEEASMAHRKLVGIAHNPHELGIIARADRFTAFLFLGRGNKHRVEYPTEAEARAAAQRLADEHGSGAMVYAVAGGSSALVCTVSPKAKAVS